MVNYINAYDIVANHRTKGDHSMFTSPEVFSASIDGYLIETHRRSDKDWHPKYTKIDENIIDWLENNINNDSWFLDMQGRNIYFKNNDDGWDFLEWLEEYEIKQ